MSEAATRKKPMDSPIAFASPPHFNQRCCGAMIAVRKNSGRARTTIFSTPRRFAASKGLMVPCTL